MLCLSADSVETALPLISSLQSYNGVSFEG